MDQHKSNLMDLYAGLAMLGLLVKGMHGENLIDEAWLIAREMIEERDNGRETEEGTVSDMAVSDLGGRQDSDTKRIAAFKKRSKRASK